MEYRQVGHSGLTVSVAGLGCNNFGGRLNAQETASVVACALDEGITLFDTAPIYSDGLSEEFLGKALGNRRDGAIVATKFGAGSRPGPGQATGSRRSIITECEESLRRLGSDHIDLYYQHYPDRFTPVEETLSALDQLVRQGKVRYVASSNLAGWQIADAAHTAARGGYAPFIASQFEWNLLKREAEYGTVPACRHFAVGMIPYFPLASGLLTGKYSAAQPFPPGTRLAASTYFAKDATADNFATIDRLRDVAQQHGHSLLQFAVGWLLVQDGVPSVISGATSVEQVRQGVEAATRPLAAEAVEAVEAATVPAGIQS